MVEAKKICSVARLEDGNLRPEGLAKVERRLLKFPHVVVAFLKGKTRPRQSLRANLNGEEFALMQLGTSSAKSHASPRSVATEKVTSNHFGAYVLSHSVAY